MSSNPDFDVIVVGAGIAGLAAAALLARAGRSVLLLERGAEVGGVCRAVDSAAGRVELGAAMLTGFGPDGSVGHLCDRLGIRLTTHPCEPIVQVATQRHRLSFFADPARLWREVRREFPAEEAGWRAFLFEMDLLAREQRNLAAVLPLHPPDGWRSRLAAWRVLWLGRISGQRKQAVRMVTEAGNIPARAALVRHGLGAAGQQMIDALLWYLSLRDADECSTLEAAMALHALREGSVTVSGGMPALVEALQERFREAGGQVRLETEVAGCLAERRRVAGVITAAGESIRARWVISTTPPEVLAGRLLPSRRGWLRRTAPVAGPWLAECSAATAAVRVPERYFPAELSGRCLVVPSAERPVRDGNFAAIHAGQEAGGIAGTPDGRTLTVCRFTPSGSPQDEGVMEASLLEALDQVLPGVSRLRTASQTFGPATLEGLWGRPRAVLRYARTLPEYLGRRGFGHRLGWTGMLWAGAWTHPGRLVSDVVEGATAVADLILETP
ncbi:MAG: NAD(P)/FAD-dependent oxidoreductase [candidate division NC10 bacterium]|nr:NAD(P)/FAD-dependent oxidoreductase [candidate division NC10 bacterium]